MTTEEKVASKQALQNESLRYELSRVDYDAARRSLTFRDFQLFVVGALCQHSLMPGDNGCPVI